MSTTLEAPAAPDRAEGAADDSDAVTARLKDAAGITSDQQEARGELPGAEWAAFAEVVGGNAPTAHKVRIVGGAIEITPPAGGFKKGRRYVMQIEVVNSGYSADDTEDTETQQVTATTETRKLKIRSGRFIPTPDA